jgi:predicted enzyme related to lactoylglutathione lyase
MAKFYQDTLGLNPITLEPHHRYGWFDAGDIVIALQGSKSDEEVSKSTVTLQFEVDDIDESIALLEQRGCEFHDKQLETGEGYQVAHFCDPEGNEISVYASR